MGTRNVTYVIKDGEYRVAQYCQWDGYPTGQGRTAAGFIVDRLQTPEGLETFGKRVSEVREMSATDVQALLKEVGADDSGWVTLDVERKFQEKYAHLDRSFGAKVLEYVYNTPNAGLSLDLEFAGDSLMCEWAYVIDLDTGMFEAYKGFNNSPVPESERFAKFKQLRNDYYPVKLVYSTPLANVTDETVQDIEDALDTDDGEEDEDVDEIEEELDAEEVNAQEMDEATVGLDVRTKATIKEGIVDKAQYLLTTTVVEYEPGNGTRYSLQIMEVTPDTLLSHSVGLCGESGWIVMHLNNMNAKPMVISKNSGPLFPAYLAEKTGECIADAYVIAEFVADYLGIEIQK